MSAKEPYKTVKERGDRAKLCRIIQSPVECAEIEPYISAKEPYISTKEHMHMQGSFGNKKHMQGSFGNKKDSFADTRGSFAGAFRGALYDLTLLRDVISLFGSFIGLFCGYIGLFCGYTWLFCGRYAHESI